MLKRIPKKLTDKKGHLANFVWRALQVGGKQGVIFVILMIAAKVLPETDFGIYNYNYATVILFTLLTDFGISKTVIKYTAEYNQKDKSKISAVFSNALIILLSLSLFFCLMLLFFGDLITGEYHGYLVYLLPVIFFLPLSSLYDGIFSGLKRFREISVISVISGIISVIAAYFLITAYKLTGAFIAVNLYYFFLFVLSALRFGRIGFAPEKEVIVMLAKYSVLVGISGFGTFLYSRANTIIFGKFGYIKEAGYYEIIDKIFVMVSFPFMIFSQVISPRITEVITSEGPERVRRWFNKMVLLSLPAAAAISFVLWYIFPVLLELFLPKYHNENFLLMFGLLIFNLPFMMVSNLLAQPFIISTGHAKYSLLTIPFGLLNITLAIIFTLLYGYIGVIYATLVSSISNKVLTYALVYKKLKE